MRDPEHAEAAGGAKIFMDRSRKAFIMIDTTEHDQTVRTVRRRPPGADRTTPDEPLPARPPGTLTGTGQLIM